MEGARPLPCERERNVRSGREGRGIQPSGQGVDIAKQLASWQGAGDCSGVRSVRRNAMVGPRMYGQLQIEASR